jgi:hypothetical protein
MDFQFGSQDPFVTRQEVGVAGGAFATNSLAISNKASGGAIGTSAATVDLYGVVLLNQTTASQTVTIPSPTDTTAGKLLVFVNVGSQSVTVLSTTVTAGAGLIAAWTGSSWVKVTL